MENIFLIIIVIGYNIMAYVIGKALWRLGFSGSETTVKLFGGIMWPMTMWLVLLVVAFDESIERK